MTTDTMREKFDEWEANVDDDDLCARFNKSDFASFDNFMLFEAYAQGQRDLIASLGEPVAYQVISHHGMDNRLYAAQDAPKGFAGFLEIERSVGNTVRALHFVPEVGE